MIYMICYDITDPKRLGKVAKILEDFGLRIQKSFFQCDITREKLDFLIKRLTREINIEEDKLFVYPICEECSRRAITQGKGDVIRLEDFEII